MLCNAGTFDVAADAYRRFTYDSYMATGSPSTSGKVWNDVSPLSNYYDTTGIVRSTGSTAVSAFKVTTACNSGNGAKSNVCYLQGSYRSRTDYDMIDFYPQSIPAVAFTICSVTR